LTGPINWQNYAENKFLSKAKSWGKSYQQQGCQIFLGPSIPNWEKYNK
jgi:hypothetical protein